VKTGLIVFGHGSSVASANQAVEKVAFDMAELGGYETYETAFLEAAQPDLKEAVARLIPKGVTRIIVLPYFLTLGIHLKRDLPRIVTELSGIYPGVEIIVTEPLDGHPALKEILLDRARRALSA
jgi:sirohydrochlorin ferrochelatase